MKKRLDFTPKSKIVSMLRRMFMYSRERGFAAKRDRQRCVECGSKLGGVYVHHIHNVDWESIIGAIRQSLLCSPDKLKCLCKECHKKTHENDEHVFKSKGEKKK